MSFTTVNQLGTISIRDMQIKELKTEGDRLTILLDGAVIRASNPHNTRYADVYARQMQLRFFDVRIRSFCLAGYRYYDADGELLETVDDTPLDTDHRRQALQEAAGAVVYDLSDADAPEGCQMLSYDVSDADGDVVRTYEIVFSYSKSTAVWERFAGPVEG